MRAWAWIGLGALLAGCSSSPTARASAEAPKKAPVPASVPEGEGASAPEAPVSGGPASPAAPAAETLGSSVHVGTYALRLSEAQKAEIAKGLETVRAQAKAGDKGAIEALPVVEAAAKNASSASIRLNADGTYVAEVAGSAASGRYRVVGDEVRFDAPADGRPAAYPTMRLDRAQGKLVAKTSQSDVEFVKQG